jgi:hypothetical protein
MMKKPRRDDKFVKMVAQRLRTEREKRFRTAKAFADFVGQEVGTYRHHENGTRSFERADAIKYARKLGVSAAFLMGMTGDDATETPEVSIMGEAALSTWHDRTLDLERNKNKNSLPIPNPSGASVRYAVLVKDESINKAVPGGDYAVCVPIDADEIELGMLVDVEHVRGNLLQRTIRRVAMKPRGEGFLLKTYSTLAQFESTLAFPSEKRDEEITILGRVIGHYAEIGLLPS